MPYHAVVRPREDGNTGDYLADPVFGGIPFLLGGSAELGLRPLEPIRIFQAFPRGDFYFARRYHRQHWDVAIPNALGKIDTSKIQAVVFYDPIIFEADNIGKPSSFIVVGRKRWQGDEILEHFRRNGELEIKKYDSHSEISLPGKEGMRAYASGGLERVINAGDASSHIFFAGVNHLLSRAKRNKQTRHLKDRELPLEVDREVLKLCIQYVNFS